MKSLSLFLALFSMILCAAFLSCHNRTTSGLPNSLSSLSKINIFIYDCDFGDYLNEHNSLSVSFFIINNTDDTLKYTDTRCLFSKFYCTDNPNMTVMDYPLPGDSLKRVVIPPHKGKYAYLGFKLRKMPVTNLKFKIGMKLVRWHAGNTKTILAEMAHEKPDTIWSNVKLVKTGKNISDPTEDQYKARILTKVLPAFSPPLTDEDKKAYTISIDQNKIKRLKDTMVDTVDLEKYKLLKMKSRVAICEMKIHNNSNDTLQYASMSCSWLEMYMTNNVDFKVTEQMCFKNVPEVKVIPPKQSSVVEIPIITDVKTVLPQKIKIGLNLQKCTGDDLWNAIVLLDLILKPKASNTIWSNEVTIR